MSLAVKLFGLVVGASMLWPLAVAAQGNPTAGKEKSAVCAGCHGEDGNADGGAFPKLAQQQASYLRKQLRDFRGKVRINAMMNGFAANLSDEDIDDLAAYYAAQTVRAEPGESSARGEQLYHAGALEKKLPACSACHGPDALGNGPAAFPMLKAQYADYLEQTLRAFRKGERGKEKRDAMNAIAAKMTDEEIHEIAVYLATLDASAGAAVTGTR